MRNTLPENIIFKKKSSNIKKFPLLQMPGGRYCA
jgi:hypothetical protein